MNDEANEPIDLIAVIKGAQTGRQLIDAVEKAIMDPPLGGWHKDDLEDAIDYLAKSIEGMETTFYKVKAEREQHYKNWKTYKEAYEKNLENNKKFFRENKALAFKIWRYDKKRTFLNQLHEACKNAFFKSKEMKQSLAALEEYPNHDRLIEGVTPENAEDLIKKYMETPLQLDLKPLEDVKPPLGEGGASEE
jgi:hypothetical protein